MFSCKLFFLPSAASWLGSSCTCLVCCCVCVAVVVLRITWTPSLFYVSNHGDRIRSLERFHSLFIHSFLTLLFHSEACLCVRNRISPGHLESVLKVIISRFFYTKSSIISSPFSYCALYTLGTFCAIK